MGFCCEPEISVRKKECVVRNRAENRAQTQHLVGGTVATSRLCHIYSSAFLSVLSSVKCRRGGILGRNGQRSHRLVPLRLCGRGGKRQSIRYNNTVKLYCIVSIFALLVVVSASFNQPESIYYCWWLKERLQSSGRMNAWVPYAHRLEEQVHVTLMFAGGPFCFTHAAQKFLFVLFSWQHFCPQQKRLPTTWLKPLLRIRAFASFLCLNVLGRDAQ